MSAADRGLRPLWRRGGLHGSGRRMILTLGCSLLASLIVLNGCGGGSASSEATAAPVPAITLSTPNLDFGAQTVGTPSVPLTLTVTNSGTGTATLSGIAIGGSNASNFKTTSDNCGNTLPAGSSCVVKVTFTPSSTNSMAATLTIQDNTSSSPQTVGLSGSGFTITGLAHGMFMLDPPVNDSSCGADHPANCYSQHLVPTFICTGNGTPVGYNCGQEGAGSTFIKGAGFHVGWNVISTSNGTYDFSMPDQWMQPWTDSGKLVSLIFEPTGFGTSNGVTPLWYMTPANISSVSQTGGIISVQTSSAMGFFPGGVGAAAGLEIQIAGTGTVLDGDGTSANPGIWTVCDHTTAGCQDPSSQTLYALGAGSDISAVSAGTVGNPVYGSNDGSTCTSGIIPIQWRPNFIKAWQAFMQQALAHYGSNSNVAYIRFGLGIGGQTNPTYGISPSDANRTACEAQMTTYGFTTAAAPWPDPGNSQWPQVTATWIAYLKAMLGYEHSLRSPKSLMVTTSPIEFGGADIVTPDATAAAAVVDAIGFGNQGLNKTDPTNFAAGQACGGGDWCANFQKFKGQVPLELQTLSVSDPENNGQTGSLVGLLPFATGMGAQILELYVDDWMCTYDTTWVGANAYAACTAAGYPAVFSATSKQIN
jgi:Abnormal spindle-like microcephaly-assoc'd, ASPM-SPD-2-Hydin